MPLRNGTRSGFRFICRLLREPLVHFLLIGTAIFAGYRLVATDGGRGPETIVVTQGRIEALATAFARTRQRPPTESELEGLIREYVREEVYYREALAMGLDRDDTVVRRRLRQKLEFLAEEAAAAAEPTDAQLLDYLATHPARFRVEPRFSFLQVYLNPERHRGTLAQEAAQLLAQLRGGVADPATLGDPSLLERRFEEEPAGQVAKQFGEAFAVQLAQLPMGEWTGPIESGLGAHLVQVTARREGRLPGLEEVRDEVRRDWENARQREASERFYESLLERYTVTIEWPEKTAVAARVGAGA